MRILKIAVLFTMLFITRGGCRPNTEEKDYQSDDGEEYPDTEDNEPGQATNLNEQGANSSVASHIITVPLKLLVHLGETVELPCNVTNSQEVVISWLKGSMPLYNDFIPQISGIEAKRIVRKNDNTLVIHNFTDSDVSDKYICRIASEPPEEIVHSLRTSKHVFVLPSETVKVDEPNTTIQLACQPNWEPKPTIEWFRDGKKVASDQLPKDGSSLTIHNVTESNSGLYQCLVGPDNTKLYPIYVLAKHAPKIEVANEIVHSGLHLESELTCQVDAYPHAEVAWYKDRKKVLTGSLNKETLPNQKTTHTLVLSRTEKSDFGKYSCEATNSVGKATRIIELTGTPEDAKFIKVDLAEDGVTPILEWEVHSNSPIQTYELEYRREGDKDWKIVNPRASDDGTINIFKVRHPLEGLQAGKYEAVLIAQNEFGWSHRPLKPTEFVGEHISAEPDLAGSRSGAASIQSLIFLRTLILVGSIFVCTTYL